VPALRITAQADRDDLDGVVVQKTLDHLGLPSEPPILARTRVGKELELGA
jgi:hypothetical protein